MTDYLFSTDNFFFFSDSEFILWVVVPIMGRGEETCEGSVGYNQTSLFHLKPVFSFNTSFKIVEASPLACVEGLFATEHWTQHSVLAGEVGSVVGGQTSTPYPLRGVTTTLNFRAFSSFLLCVLSHFSHVRLFVTPRTAARHAPLSKARILECVAVPSSRGSSRPRDRIRISSVSCIGRRLTFFPTSITTFYRPAVSNRAFVDKPQKLVLVN